MFRFGVARCCCGCVISEDAFGSADALSGKWSGDVSSFSKSSGVITSTTSSKLIYASASHPTGSYYEATISARTKATSGTDNTRLIGYYEDASNYVFIEVTHGATLTMKLWQRKAGTNTQLGTTRTLSGKATGDYVLLRLCIYGNTAYAEALTTSGSVTTSGGLNTSVPFYYGRYAGVGTGSLSGTAAFDDFSFAKNRSLRGDCPQCDACDTELFEDSFTSETFGWSDSYSTWTLSGGRMQAVNNGSNIRCMVRPTIAVGTVIEGSCYIWDQSGGGGGAASTTNMLINSTSLTGQVAIGAAWPLSIYRRRIGATLTDVPSSPTPANGDKIGIRMTCDQVSPQRWDIEWLVNDSVVDSANDQTITVLDPFYFGMSCTVAAFPLLVEFDDFTISAA